VTMADVTDVRFYGVRKGNFICYVSAVIGRNFILKHMRLVVSKKEGERVILSMPCRQDAEGEWRELYHPIRREVRDALESAVLAAYAKREAAVGTAKP